jgi:hypothetical protein
MSSTDSAFDATLKRLMGVRLALLRLHKALLDSERLEYEQTHGRIRSTGEFFQLVLDDEWFSWLRPMSQFIVQIDEALSDKEPIALENAKDLLAQARALLQPSQQGTVGEQKYDRAIQRDPDIAFMHAELSNLLATDVEFQQ